MKTKAIIFDKDGTLFDFQATWGVWTNTVLDAFCGDDLILKRRVADDLDYDLNSLEIQSGSIVIAATPREIAARVALYFPQLSVDQRFKRLNALAQHSTQVPVTDLRAMCADLRGLGLKLAVMTNDAQAPALSNLKGAGVLDLFDFVIGSDSGYGAKPDAAPLIALAGMMQVDPNDCVMVGDSTHDLCAGRAAGMGRVAVLTGLAGRAELAPYADVVLPSIAGLADWISADR